MKRQLAITVITVCGLVQSTHADEAFDDCGTLVQGAECVLFDADAGGRFVLGRVESFAPSDRVRVTGRLDRTCATTCLEGDGCITNNTISPCTTRFTVCGTLVQGVECVLFQTDGGNRYVLDNLGGFNVGDKVRVVGDFTRDCVSICQEGNGCIKYNTIVKASTICDAAPPPDRCGAGILQLLFPMLLAMVALRITRV